MFTVGGDVMVEVESVEVVKGLKITVFDMRNQSSHPEFKGDVAKIENEHEHFLICLDTGFEIWIEQVKK